MVREDLVNGAVSFLQDPSVASAPLEQRIAFLQSKNLTQEEIDLSLQRAGSEPPASTSGPVAQQQNYGYQQPAYRQQQQYGGYQQNSYWPQPPPEVPRRDWRDWFIMATVMGGIGYGCYFVAKRYVYPLVAPPTPPQLEQDKASIDASFDKAFALLDQLATDTEELKSSEKARTERLDTALSEVESVIGQMKEANRKRDDEGRRMGDEMRSLRDLIPKAMKAQEETADMRLKELSTEMKSLKTLINNRMTSGQAPRMSAPYQTPPAAQTNNPSTPASDQPQTASPVEGSKSIDANGVRETERPSSLPDRTATSSPYGRMMNGRAAIPAWQMAASKANQDAKQDTAESGTAVDGATP